MTDKRTSKTGAALVALTSLCTAAHAQEAPVKLADAELPAVVVEGATIEAKPAAVPKMTKTPAPVAEEAAAPPKPAPKKKAAASAPKPPSGAPQPGTDPSAPASAAQAPPDEVMAQTSGEEGRSSGGVAAEKIGSSVSIVTADEIKSQQVRNAADALRNLPGVAVNRSGGFNGLTQLRIRGAEGNQTLVLIDGVEANETFNGEFDFSHLSADDIERIEVLRGPQSGLYGSGAIGGVVNIVTRGGRGPLTFRTYGEAGSFNTKAGNIGVSGGNDKVWGAVSLSDRRTDGFNIAPVGGERDGSELKTLNFRAGAQLLPGVTLDLSLRHTNKQGDRDQDAFFPDTSGVQVDDPATFAEKTFVGGAALTVESLDGHLIQVLKSGRSETDRADHAEFFGTPSDTVNSGLRETVNYRATYRLDTTGVIAAHHYFTGLAEHEQEAFTPKSDFGFGFAGDGIERTRDLDAVAGEYRGEFADILFLQGTVRHDSSSVFGDFNTWRTAASLVLRDAGLRPHASYGTGVKLPTMFESFGSIPGAYYANPDLKPEESRGWDAGLEWTVVPGAAVVDVTYFDNIQTGKIRNFANCRPAAPPFFNECTAVNDPGESTRKGIEVSSRFSLGSGLSLGLAYTYTDARDPGGIEEIRRPRHAGRGEVNYVFDGGRGNLNVSAEYTGPNPDTNFGSFMRVSLDPYWLVNVAASYKVMPGVELFGRVENALDADYQEVFGYETAGIAAYAGVKLTYEEPSTLDWAKYK